MDYYAPGLLSVPVDTTFGASGPGLNYNGTSFYPAMSGDIGADTQCAVAPYDPPPLASESFWPFDSITATAYRYRRQQSVNLGSW